MLLKVRNNRFDIAIHQAIQRSIWDMVTFVLTTAVFYNGENKCRRSQ